MKNQVKFLTLETWNYYAGVAQFLRDSQCNESIGVDQQTQFLPLKTAAKHFEFEMKLLHISWHVGASVTTVFCPLDCHYYTFRCNQDDEGVSASKRDHFQVY